MRKRSLVKKIGVVLLATMILTSIGLTGFATGIVDGSTAADLSDRVSATISVSDIAGGYGFYNVAVTYTNNSDDSIVGITMLAYAETANDTADGLANEDIPAGYSEDLQIVGIDQTEVASNGTFNFLVDTNPDTNSSGAIRMDRGDSGIVLLSADGALAPTGYIFTIPAAQEFTVETATPDNASITVPYGTSLEDAVAALESESITVSGNGVTERSWTANNWNFATDYSATTSGTYAATGSLVVPQGSLAQLGTTTTVSIDVIVAEPTLVWTATTATLANLSVTVPTGGDEDAIIRAALLEKSITIDDDVESTPAALVPITEEIADTLEIQDESTKQYLLAVLPGSPVVAVPGHKVEILSEIEVYFTITVTYDGTVDPGEPDDPTGFDATGIEARDSNGNEVTAIEVDNGTSEADAIAAINAAIASVVAVGDGESEEEEWTVSGWTIANYNATTAGNYTATATLQAPDESLVNNPASLTLTITVTVKEAEGGDEPGGETYTVGDVNGAGGITNADWQLVLKYVKGDRPDGFILDAADANGAGGITNADWQLILKYVKGDRSSNVGTTVTK